MATLGNAPSLAATAEGELNGHIVVATQLLFVPLTLCWVLIPHAPPVVSVLVTELLRQLLLV